MKAWLTIKRKRRESASRVTRKLEEFASPVIIGAILHPEITVVEKEPEFGRGLIKQFQKTPEDIVCGKFWELRWAFGCPLDCNYCYLRGTLKGRMKPSFVRSDTILKALDEALEKIRTPSLFNTGELSDSLMNPSLMAKIADKFEEQRRHKLVTLSKFGPKAVGFLLEKIYRQTICAWSINPLEVALRWEKAAARPQMRIGAARLVAEAGYDTRVRIDPIFPIEGWKTHYENLLYSIFSAFEPRRMILGTPRGLWKTIKYAQAARVDMSWAYYFGEDTGWGKKIGFGTRREIYSWFYDKLSAIGYDLSRVSMCKETTEMWKSMQRNFEPLTCQCYGPRAFAA